MALTNEEIAVVLRDDPFEILGIERDASNYELVSAYRTKARQYHPDLHPGDVEYKVMMQAVNDAYQRILSGKIDRDVGVVSDFSWKPMAGYDHDAPVEAAWREDTLHPVEHHGPGPAPTVFKK